MLKSYLKSLSDDGDASSEIKSSVTIKDESVKSKDEMTPAICEETVSTAECVSMKYCNDGREKNSVDSVHFVHSKYNVQGTSGVTLVDDSVTNISLNEEYEEFVDASGSDKETSNDGDDDRDAILNRFDLLPVTDDTCDTVTDGHSTHNEGSSTAASTIEREASNERFVIKEVSSRRKKDKRKHRRRMNDGECINADDVDALLSVSHESNDNEAAECIIKSTAVNPLNIRVERKYLSYSTELKLKSLCASEAALYKRQLSSSKHNNRHLPSNVNKFCLGNASSFPSLSKLDASMQFDLDNPSSHHVLGANVSTQGIKSYSGKKAPRNMCDLQLFKIVHHDKYQQLERQLSLLVSSVEYEVHSGLVTMLTSYPCHLETLVQLACLVEGSDAATSAQLIERAVIALESIFHPRFLPSSSACRMDYRRRENRVYFITLLKHAQFISQVHTCHRAAFEMCKSLYIIDPLNDPLASLLVLDHYALACGQYSWIIDVYQQSVQDASVKDKLHHLPNWSYSVALAAYLSRQYCLADSLMDEALTRFPSLLRHLLDQCSVEPDKQLTHCKYFDFRKASNHLPKSLDILILLYTKRSACHWAADRKILHWLETRVRLFVQAYGEDSSLKRNLISNELFFQRNPLPAKNILRHVALSGISSLRDQVIDSAEVTKYYDLNPPDDEIESYSLKAETTGEANAHQSDGILGLFLKSLLPDYSITSQSMKTSMHGDTVNPNSNQRETPAIKATVAPADNLKSSVSSVLSAVKDLLSSMTPQNDDEQADARR